MEQHSHLIDVNEGAWKSVRLALIDFIVAETNRLHPGQVVDQEDILAFGEKPLPYFNVKISDFETLAKRRRMKVVRYAEPTGY